MKRIRFSIIVVCLVGQAAADEEYPRTDISMDYEIIVLLHVLGRFGGKAAG